MILEPRRTAPAVEMPEDMSPFWMEFWHNPEHRIRARDSARFWVFLKNWFNINEKTTIVAVQRIYWSSRPPAPDASGMIFPGEHAVMFQFLSSGYISPVNEDVMFENYVHFQAFSGWRAFHFNIRYDPARNCLRILEWRSERHVAQWGLQNDADNSN